MSGRNSFHKNPNRNEVHGEVLAAITFWLLEILARERFPWWPIWKCSDSDSQKQRRGDGLPVSLLTTLQLRNCSRNLGYLFKVASWGSSGSLRGWLMTVQITGYHGPTSATPKPGRWTECPLQLGPCRHSQSFGKGKKTARFK